MSDLVNIPAAIEPLNAKEFIAAQAVQSEVTTKIIVRYQAGFRATQRIRHGETIYNPAGVLRDKKSGVEWVVFPCSEGVNEG